MNNDLAAVLALSEEDEAVHGAYQEFFRVFNRTETMEVADDAQMDDFRRTVMVSRYLDRIANISMDPLSPRVPAHRSALGRRRHRRCG